MQVGIVALTDTLQRSTILQTKELQLSYFLVEWFIGFPLPLPILSPKQGFLSSNNENPTNDAGQHHHVRVEKQCMWLGKE